MKKLLIFALCAAAPAALNAEQWQILGTRPMGMGGAFVAVAQGPIAQYWNPGGLVKSSANVSGMEIPVGVNAEFTGGIVKDASKITDMAAKYSALQSAQTSGGAMNADQFAAFAKAVSLMSDMNDPGKGALAEVAAGVDFKFAKVALSVNNYTSIGLSPYIDTRNIGLGAGTGVSGVNMAAVSAANPADTTTRNTMQTAITTMGGLSAISTLLCGTAGCLTGQNAGITNDQTLANALYNQAVTAGMTTAQITEAANTMSQYASQVAPFIANASSNNTYANNTSNLTVKGAAFTEIAAGYAWNVDKWLHGLSVGANLKMINGQTVGNSFRFLSESKTGDAFKMDDPKSSWRPAIDLGLLWNVNRTYPKLPLSPKVGFVMRNVNSPSFDTTAGPKYHLNRQARLGFALNPFRFWTLALDVDMTKNKTPVAGFESRELSMGTEINVFNRKAFNIPLRAGMIKNVAEKSSKMAYTLGTGINLLYMHLDVAGVVSSEKTQLDDKDIPTKLGVSANFGLLF